MLCSYLHDCGCGVVRCVLYGSGALISFLDLLATSFPGKMNRASFRNLAAELKSDPGMNDMTR